MQNSSIKIEYETTHHWEEETQHGMFLSVYQFAQSIGVFKRWELLKWKMKKVTFSPLDKLKVLWASIGVGCKHTSAINDKLGKHELALSKVFGLESFPDQSQINRLLTATGAEQVEKLRETHLSLLRVHSRARQRSKWLKLANGRRILVADLDQRGVVVQGKQFELAKEGYFSHRGRRGYQLTAMFFGGQIGEVVDEYFDSGDVPMIRRLADLLRSLSKLCQQIGIDAKEVLIRSDAQLGTPAAIQLIESLGFQYLLKGLSPQKAEKLVNQCEEVFWRVKPGSQAQQRWMGDLGKIEHLDQSEEGKGRKVESRTLVQVRTEQREPTRKGKHRKRVSEAQTIIRRDYYLTSLSAEELPVEDVLMVYDDRATIERYFYDEQYALGAKQVRTHHFAGEAFFQLLVAMTNNILKWCKEKVYKKTKIEKFGLKRLINQVMQIPGRIKKNGRKWLVILPQSHHLIKQLEKSWKPLFENGVP